MNDKLKVFFDTTPLRNANALRGIGMYTRFLTEELEKNPDVEILKIKNKKVQPDIIHYPFFDLYFPTLPFFRKQKTVVTVHDVIPMRFPEFYSPGKRGRVQFYRQKFALQHVQAVITDSEASKKDIIFYLKIAESKVHVVSLAGNPHIHRTSETHSEDVRRALHLPTKFFLYVGDINYNKNIPQLIKSLKFLPDDLHLVCVGKNFYPHPIVEWKRIETQIALSDVSNRVHFVTDIGKDTDDMLSALYTAAEMYVQPSVYEGFGLPVLEAMQSETPVVSSQNSSLIEVGGNFVEFVESDAAAISQGISRVLAWSSEHRAKRIKEALEWSHTFSWKRTADETLHIYKTL